MIEEGGPTCLTFLPWILELGENTMGCFWILQGRLWFVQIRLASSPQSQVMHVRILQNSKNHCNTLKFSFILFFILGFLNTQPHNWKFRMDINLVIFFSNCIAVKTWSAHFFGSIFGQVLTCPVINFFNYEDPNQSFWKCKTQ